MNPVQAVALLVLRRQLERLGAYAYSKAADQLPGRAKRLLVHYRETSTQAVAQAVRRAWLTLEIAFAGPVAWSAASRALSTRKAKSFRRQMEALLDIISLAGLPSDGPASQQRCFEETRAARTSGLVDVVFLDAPALGSELPGNNGSISAAANESAVELLEQTADGFRQGGYHLLAHLIELLSPWGQPLFVELVEFFLHRLVRQDAAIAKNLPDGSRTESPWRCLEIVAQILDERQEEIEGLLADPQLQQTDYVSPGRDDEAIEQFFHQGLNRLLHGDYQQAVVQFTAALKLDASNAAIYAHRGDAHRLQGENDRAIADFEAALRLNPTDAVVLVNRAMSYLSAGEHNHVVADCNAALVSNPHSASAYRVRGAAYAALESADLAIADLDKAIRLAPADEEAYYQRGVLNMGKHDFERAVLDFNQVLRLNKHRVHAYLQRGQAYRNLNNYKSAIRDYSEALRRHPNNVQAYAGRGSAYRLRGDLDLAQADYEKALLLEPGNARIRCSFGVLHRIRGDLKKARVQLDEAIRLEPDNWSALYHRGKIAIVGGRFDAVLADLDAALKLNHRIPVAYLSRAIVYDHTKQFQKALHDASQAITLDPHFAVAHLVRGIIHNHREVYDSAVVDLSEAIARDSRLAWAYHERSLGYTAQREYSEALADCNRFLALEPRNAQGFAHRSTVYQLVGDAQKSLVDYTLAAQLDPQCFRTAWDKGRAEEVHLAAIRRLADEIDGMRPQIQAGQDPPMAPFRIVLQAWPAGSIGVARTAGGEAIPIEAPPLHPAPAKPESSKTTPESDGCPSVPSAPAVYLNRMDRPIYSPVRLRKRSEESVDDEIEEPGLWNKWKRAALILSGLAALVLVSWVIWPKRSDRVSVHLAQGQAFFNGKPMPNATVVLEPVWTKEPKFPKPRAVIKDDGTFILATYGKDDGAPAGEYKVSVQWFVKTDNRPEIEGGTLPQNVLPAKYANPESSGLNVEIKEGTNIIPPLQLKR
jgi:tetratricopeptide (TPR) repeat protein